ncbi:MAG: hypothetical protein LLF92_07070 [Planctomycetaceae bacterium]|nr:hypothetical protein [Planctomycetaceae bacterium]
MTTLVFYKTYFAASKMRFDKIHYQRKIKTYEQSNAVVLGINKYGRITVAG